MKCADCIYYDEFTPKDYSTQKGHCRLNPPSFVGDEATWPRVYNDDWCGKLEPKCVGHHDGKNQPLVFCKTLILKGKCYRL